MDQGFEDIPQAEAGAAVVEGSHRISPSLNVILFPRRFPYAQPVQGGRFRLPTCGSGQAVNIGEFIGLSRSTCQLLKRNGERETKLKFDNTERGANPINGGKY